MLLPACGTKARPPVAPIEVTFDAGTAALHQKNYRAAEGILEEVVQRDPRDVRAFYDLGVAYQAQDLDRNALRAYNRALAVAPDFVAAIFNRATLYGSTNPLLAMYLYRRVIALQPDAPTAYLNLGLLQAKASDADARASLRRAVSLDPALDADIPPGLLEAPAASGSPQR